MWIPTGEPYLKVGSLNLAGHLNHTPTRFPSAICARKCATLQRNVQVELSCPPASGSLQQSFYRPENIAFRKKFGLPIMPGVRGHPVRAGCSRGALWLSDAARGPQYGCTGPWKGLGP